MRFPRLSYLFHRRVKSDSELAGLPVQPMATLASRPVSADGLDELVLATNKSSEVLFPYISGVPISVTHPLPPTTNATPDPPSQPEMFPELKQRVRELEMALQLQYKANRRIPALEVALKTERAALHAAKEAHALANSELSTLRASLIHTQRSLKMALTNPGADDRARVLAAENAALTAERLRHRNFIQLMISVGGHKPVLDTAYRALCAGTDPEAALVTAIKEAVSVPASPWAVLLEPVVGQGVPTKYAAQIQLTLEARKDAKGYRKKAKFWKLKAREDGRYAETVTPSPSDISSIVEELPEDRRRAMQGLIARRRSLPQPSHAADTVVECPVPVRPIPSPPSVLATLASSLEYSSSSYEQLHGSEAEAELQPSASSSAYSNLAPLASEVLRASLSIQSRRSTVSFPLSASLSRSLQALSKGTISASSSRSSQSKGKQVEIPRDVCLTAIPAPEAVVSTVSSLARLAYIAEESLNLDACPSGSTCSPAHDWPVPGIVRPPMDLAVPENTYSDEDDELVIVMHSDAIGSPLPQRTRATLDSSTLTPDRSPRLRAASPPEKSRLPVLKRAIRRLSISRPVLVDTTNAATFSFSTAAAPKVQAEAKAGVKGVGGNAQGQWRAGTGSPPRPSKIPMGKCIQMPVDIMGKARQAVQTKTCARTSSA